MVTQLTVGLYYICDWLTGADGDAQDLDTKAEGTDFLQFYSPLQLVSTIDVDVMDDYYPGDAGYFMRWDIKAQQLHITGYTSNHTEADNIENYIGRHIDNGSSPEYFFWRRSSTVNDFKKFYKGSTAYEYARGFLKQNKASWTHSENTLYTINLIFQVVWS